MIMQLTWGFEFPLTTAIKSAVVRGVKTIGHLLGFGTPTVAVVTKAPVKETPPEVSIYDDVVVRDNCTPRREEVWQQYVVKNKTSLRTVAKKLGVPETIVRKDIHVQLQHSMGRAHYRMATGKSSHEIYMDTVGHLGKCILVRLVRMAGELEYTKTQIGGIYPSLHRAYAEWFRTEINTQYGFPKTEYVHYKTAARTPSLGVDPKERETP